MQEETEAQAARVEAFEAENLNPQLSCGQIRRTQLGFF